MLYKDILRKLQSLSKVYGNYDAKFDIIIDDGHKITTIDFGYDDKLFDSDSDNKFNREDYNKSAIDFLLPNQQRNKTYNKKRDIKWKMDTPSQRHQTTHQIK